MSGGDSGMGLGPVVAPDQDCNNIKIKIRLISINDDTLSLVNINDNLSIEIQDESVVAVYSLNNTNYILGAIASVDVVKLKKCIEEGYTYRGIITEKDDNKCVITIIPDTFEESK